MPILANDGGKVVLTWFRGGTERGAILFVSQHMLLNGIFAMSITPKPWRTYLELKRILVEAGRNGEACFAPGVDMDMWGRPYTDDLVHELTKLENRMTADQCLLYVFLA
jgi:hypothetical protein